MAKRRGAGKQNRMWTRLLILVLALVAGIMVTGRVFTLREVVVIGNGRYSDNDITRMAQLPFGTNIFQLEEEEIAANFLGSGYVEFISARRRLPDTVELTVRERTPQAMINYLGVTLIIDESGYIMEQRSDIPDMDVMIVTGVKLNSFQVGQKIASTQPNQLEAMSAVLSGIRAKALEGKLSELNVADLDNMYVMTRTGMMVVLGNAEAMDRKLVQMQGMLDQLASEGVLTGVLYVSGTESSVYSAE